MVYRVVVDLSQFQSKMRGLNTAIEQTITEGLKKCADDAIQGAKSDVPVDTGELRDSIEITNQGGNFIEVAATAEHAAYVEFGTIHQAAQPYMGVQADRMQSEAPRIFLNILKSKRF